MIINAQRDFDGLRLLIVGATSGTGAPAFILVASRSAHAIGVRRNKTVGHRIVDELRAAGLSAEFHQTDISDMDAVANLFAKIGQTHGEIDGAINNNAAMSQDPMPIDATPLDLFDRLFDINVRGTWNCLGHEMRMMRGKGGNIVNMASISGFRGFQGLSAYCASKHAVIGMTKSAALDGAQSGIRVNCVCSGTTKTPMMEKQMATRPGGLEASIGRIPMGKVSAPDEQARVALWLLSDEASFVTGESVTVDGGITVR